MKTIKFSNKDLPLNKISALYASSWTDKVLHANYVYIFLNNDEVLREEYDTKEQAYSRYDELEKLIR